MGDRPLISKRAGFVAAALFSAALAAACLIALLEIGAMLGQLRCQIEIHQLQDTPADGRS